MIKRFTANNTKADLINLFSFILFITGLIIALQGYVLEYIIEDYSLNLKNIPRELIISNPFYWMVTGGFLLFFLLF